MTSTIEIAHEVKAWLGNFEMLKSFAGGAQPEIWAMRTVAIAEFERLGFPTTKHEEWKYTSLRKLATGNFQPAFRPGTTVMDGHRDQFLETSLPAGFTGDVIVLVNGHFHPALSRIDGGAIAVQSLKSALADEHPIALAHFGKVAQFQDRALVALNAAIAADGAFICIPKKVSATQPIAVVHLSDGNEIVAQSRSLIVAEDFAEAKVVEIFLGADNAKTWENHVSEIVLGVGANLELCTIQNEVGTEYALTHFTQVHQGKDSTFRSYTMSGAGMLVRNDLQALHLGTGCNTHFNGLTVLDGDAHVDHHTLVDHAMPHCYSNETYKTVLDGNSTCVFNGKVMVRPDAQKTNAFQSNKTLLLSPGASVHTKPQLEIFADDVKCSHGATTGQLDETALFYMRSRGLSDKRARALLTYAFGAELLDHISIPAVRESLEHELLTRLGGQ